MCDTYNIAKQLEMTEQAKKIACVLACLRVCECLYGEYIVFHWIVIWETSTTTKNHQNNDNQNNHNYDNHNKDRNH